jgi:TPR repeat protein
MFEEVKKALGANWFRAFVVAFGCLWVWHTFFSTVAEVGTAKNVIAQGDNAAVREPAIAKSAVADAEIKEAAAREALARQKAERESAEAEARIREATAREALARQKAERESAEAEAKIREATARETLRRQKAEADEAEARALKTKADGCSARAKANADNMRIDQSKMQEAIASGNIANFNPFSTIDTKDLYDEELVRDCDPAHAKMRSTTGNLREAPCFQLLQEIYDQMPSDLEKAGPLLEKALPAWRNRCKMIGNQEYAVFKGIHDEWFKKVTGVNFDDVLAQPPPRSPTTSPKPAAPAPTRTIEPTPAVVADNPVPDDPDVKAVQQYKLAADRGDAEAQFNLANMYYSGKGGLQPDPQETARLYRLSADQGYAQAQLSLAFLYEKGDGVFKDLREAAKYYHLAADQGSPAAQANLADAYEKGAGVPKNLCEAKRFREFAAAQGNSYAQKMLKEMRVPARCKNTIAAR